MNLQDMSSMGEIVTSIATVITLFYLAIQIRAANVLQTAESRRAVHHSTGEISSIIAQSTENARIFRIGVSDYESLNEDQQVQFDWIFALVLGQAVDSFEDMQLGIGKKDYFETYFFGTFQMLRAPGGRSYWARRKRNYSLDFREFVESNILT